MSSGIALHFEKHRADGGNINGLQRHNERKPGGRHGNENIRDEDTDKNVFLYADDRKLKQRIDDRLELGYTGKKKIRKDAIRLVEGTVQISGDILEQPDDVQEEFFSDAFDWLKHRYGEDNVVSAVIHKDETTMHLHFDFVPLTDDGKLSAKTIISPVGLKSVQSDFLKHMQYRYPSLNFERGDGKNNGLPQESYKALTEETKRQKKIVDDYRNKTVDDVNEQRRKLNKDVNNYNSERGKFNDYQDRWRAWANGQNASIKKNTDKLDARQSKLDDKSTILNNKTNELAAWSNELTERETNIEARETSLTKQEADLDTRTKQADTREQKLDDKKTGLDEREKALDDKESRLTALMDKIKQVADSVATMPKMLRNKVITTFKNYSPIDSESKAQQLVNKLDEDGLTKGLGDINNQNQGRGL